MKARSIKTLSVSIALMASALLTAQANAASACKGLSSDACASSAQCSWVGAYERKDGRQVNAFCRTKSKASANKIDLKTNQVAKAK